MSPKHKKKTLWIITCEPEVVDCKMFLMEISIRRVTAAMTYDVPFLRHVTSNKTYDFCIFSKFVNVVSIDLKIGTHIDWTCNYVHCKNIHR